MYIDISNWTINEINNSINTFKDTSLTDIGMVNCDINTINKVGTLTNATLWVGEHINMADYNGVAPIKIYREDKLEIKLNSPLLEGDTIEVKDGKICHVHRMDKVVFDGSEDWKTRSNSEGYCRTYLTRDDLKLSPNVICNTINSRVGVEGEGLGLTSTLEGISGHKTVQEFRLYLLNTRLTTSDAMGVKQWLQVNPITVIYELAEPYYEDITPLQSSIILKTFLESFMIINTNLPIKTNVSYRTNVPSISALSTRATELAESDNVIHNLMNIIDDEVDE